MSEEITAYPLHWPIGWKRTTAGARESAPFHRKDRGENGYKKQLDITLQDAVKATLHELGLMVIKQGSVIISTNVVLRLDGYPRSGQPAPTDPGVAVWWMKGGNWQSIAIDKYNRVADNLMAVAKTLEALRGISRWGSGEILARTYSGFQQLAHLPERTWWVVLDCKRDDSAPAIEEAYRKARKRTHPDQLEGSEKDFLEVQQAWEFYQKERGHA